MIFATLSGNAPPTGFLILLWTLTVFFLVIAVAAPIMAWRLRSPIESKKPGGRVRGGGAQSGCLVAGGVPSLFLGVFLLVWAVQIS
ncbi:MAG: hypothetical protein ABI360_09055 [Allobranchiibius sp.]